MRVDTLAFRKSKNATTRKLASEVGFCVIDENANIIAGNLIALLLELASSTESRINRLYRGREAFLLSEGERQDLVKLANQYAYIEKTAREVLEAQEASETVTLHAAE